MEHQPAEYIACFEYAFEEPFDRIAFDKMDFFDVAPRLLTLAECLVGYYATVVYPPAASGEVIPFVTSQARGQDDPPPNPYLPPRNPPLWHDDIRRVLLFAHKVVFEDPLPEVLGVVLTYLHPGLAGAWTSHVRQDHLAFLHRALVNVQALELLIKRGIVIPHCLVRNRLPGYDFDDGAVGGEFNVSGDTTRAMNLSDSLAALISSGELDGFQLPENAVALIKGFASSRKAGWRGVHWWEEFFDDIARTRSRKIIRWPIEPGDPLEYWADHIHRIASLKCYIDEHRLGYSPHFLDGQGCQIYEILEAADLATGREFMESADTIKGNEGKYSKIMQSDRVYISRLDSFMRPKNEILKDKDLVSIRLDEPLFARWRSTVKETLEAVRQCELETGVHDQTIVSSELTEKYEVWRSESALQLKGGFLRDAFDLGKGFGLTTIANVLLGKATFGLSIAIPVVRKLLGAGVRTFDWRKDQGIYNRHFLSIM
jgi:hypothetical protein